MQLDNKVVENMWVKKKKCFHFVGYSFFLSFFYRCRFTAGLEWWKWCLVGDVTSLTGNCLASYSCTDTYRPTVSADECVQCFR